jgi:hypothetical protein
MDERREQTHQSHERARTEWGDIGYHPRSKAAEDILNGYREGNAPLPLVPPIPPAAEYPLTTLGPVLSPAAQAIAELVQVPLALAGNSVLAAAALATQAHADIMTLGGRRPLSLFLLTIADSGDRKTAADEVALAAVHEHAKRRKVDWDAAIRDWNEKMAVLAAEHRQARAELGNKKATEQERTAAKETVSRRGPPRPRDPEILSGDPTSEGLYKSFQRGQLSQGIFNDEAGQFLAGHALNRDNEIKTIAFLSKAWQGRSLNRTRATDDVPHSSLYGRRLSMHLMVQPKIAERATQSELYRSQGFLARLLLCHQDSIAGSRLRDENAPPMRVEEDPRIARYGSAISALLREPPREDLEVGGLDPRVLEISQPGFRLLVRAYNEIERAQARGRALEDVRAWASKSMEHACRIAGVLALIANPNAGMVGAEEMAGALKLTEYYLSEYQRLVGVGKPTEDVAAAQALLDWMQRRMAAGAGNPAVSERDITRLATPKYLRAGRMARKALAILDEHRWLEPAGSGRWRLVTPPQAPPEE